jgi:hypothetical protein
VTVEYFCLKKVQIEGGEMNQALYAHMNNKRKMKKKKSPNCCFDLYAITLNISITMVFKTLIDCTLSSVSSKDDITKIFNSDRSACFLFSLVRPDHTAFSYVTKFGTIYLYQESISSNSKYIIKLQQPEM